ncbi:MAG: M23 family metallopeptidase [Chitinophagales bacterium]|nr:M23 family metallopeptidase [Chitinophagales bacterium]
MHFFFKQLFIYSILLSLTAPAVLAQKKQTNKRKPMTFPQVRVEPLPIPQEFISHRVNTPLLDTIFLLPPVRKRLPNPCEQFDAFSRQVHEGGIDEYHGKTQLLQIVAQIDQYYAQKGGVYYGQESWIFPVEGYGSDAIGGNGSGFKAAGYNYFTRRTGHPAHDIFIHDGDQDSFDDQTLQPVNVLSLSGGVVVSAEHYWDSYSTRRGGVYVWIYDPASRRLFYYAHHTQIFVKVGDLVKPGQIIGQVGRTGFNAAKMRSPTHLHTSCHLIGTDGSVTAYNFYDDLCAANRRRGTF